MIAIRSHMIVGCAALAAAVVALSVDARADQNLNCDAYAAAAVAQQNENLALRCGFAGGAWSANYEGHRAWCLLPGVAMANLTHEDRARADGLKLCKQKQAACADYAALAVEQNQSNRRFGCGLAGGRWSDNATGHRDWCMTANANQTTSESKARQTALLKCNLKRAGDDAQLANIDLQHMQQKQQQVLQAISNISKAMHESAMGAIRNMQ